MLRLFLKIIPVILFLVFFGIQTADAAILQLNSDKEVAAIGDTIKIDIKIDSEGVGINAAEAVIQFPSSILEATSISKTDSIFNFWLEDPEFSNSEGRISFVGGATSGFSGASLQVLEVTFKVNGSGDGELVFLDGAVTASDGSGTNVLREMRGINISIAPQTQVSPGVAPSPVPPPDPVPPPVQITRPPVPTGKLPIKPVVSIPLYPDQDRWYNLSSKFSAVWDLPDDVTTVAAWLNNAPFSIPTLPEGLFESKGFVPLDDGIWYLHVRFRNDVGWGPTTHYKISIDTDPPVPFQVSLDTELETDNPTPTIKYKSGDNLSGLIGYSVRVSGGDAVNVQMQEAYKLSPLPPGNQTVTVTAIDNAGNATESSVDILVLPIESPVIVGVSEKVFLDEPNITISGTALVNSQVHLVLKSERGDLVSERSVGTDGLGNWAGTFDEPLKKGLYIISARAVDSRGAQSLMVNSSPIMVVERPIITVAGVGITQAWFFVGFTLIIVFVYILGLVSQIKLHKMRSRNILISQRDIVAISNQIDNEADGILRVVNSPDIGDINSQVNLRADRIKKNTEKMRKYIVGHIGEINE